MHQSSGCSCARSATLTTVPSACQCFPAAVCSKLPLHWLCIDPTNGTNATAVTSTTSLSSHATGLFAPQFHSIAYNYLILGEYHFQMRIWTIITMDSLKHCCIATAPAAHLQHSSSHTPQVFQSQSKIVPWISCIDDASSQPDATSPSAMVVRIHRICTAIGATHFKVFG